MLPEHSEIASCPVTVLPVDAGPMVSQHRQLARGRVNRG
jgi:hypothetical protein